MSSNTIYQTYAAKYYELGFNPIPVFGKAPALLGWSQFCTRRMTELELNQLIYSIGSKPGVGVGFALGLGCWALDVDTNDERVIDLMPPSPMVKFGSKGRTALYRWHQDKMPRGLKPRHDVDGIKYVVPIELLANGSQSIIPPSSHPDGGTYVWSSGSYECRLEELPLVEPLEVIETIKAFCIKHSILKPIKVGDRMRLDMDVSDDHLPIGIGSRNNVLTSIAYAKVCNMNLNLQTRDQLVQEILEYDQKMHGACAWFSDPAEHKNKKTAIQRAGDFIDRAIASAEKKGEMYPVMEIALSEDVDVVNTELPSVELGPMALKPSDRYIESLMDQVPFLTLFRHDLKKRATSYSSGLTLGAGLSVLSAMGANLLEFNGQRSNMFVLNVATSSDGKDAPQAMVRDLLNKVRQQTGLKIFSSESYKSSAVVRRNIESNKRHIKFDVQDEIGDLFQKMNGVTSPTYGIINILNKLFTASNKTLGADDAQDVKYRAEPIANPSLTLLGATTFEGLKSLVTGGNVLKGIGGRFVYMMQQFDESRLPNKLFVVRDTTLSPALVDQVTKWLVVPPKLDEEVGVYHNTHLPEQEKKILCKQVEATEEAIGLLDNWVSTVSSMKAQAYREGVNLDTDPFITITGRSIEIILRLCVLWYVGHDEKRVVDREAVE
jgi:hypothetical protein